MLELIDEALREGLPITAICSGHRGWLIDPDPGQVALAREDIPRLLEGSAALGAPLILVPIYGRNRKFPAAYTGRTQEEDEALWLDGLRAATADADRSGRNGRRRGHQPLREQPLGDGGRCVSGMVRHGRARGKSG